MRGIYGIGRGGSLQLVKRIKWVLHQKQIEGYRARIMAHTCTLSLTMSAMGKSMLLCPMIASCTDVSNSATLLDIQHKLDIALSTHQLQDLERERIPYAPDTPSPGDDDSVSSSPMPPISSLARGSIDTDTTLINPDLRRSPSFASSSKARISGPVPLGTPDMGDAKSIAGEHGLENDPPDIGKVVAEAKALLECRPQELSEFKRPRTPPQVDPPYPEYVVDQETAQRFRTAALAQESRSVRVGDWLRCAGWWLLKVCPSRVSGSGDTVLTVPVVQSRTSFSVYNRGVRGESPYSSLRGASLTPMLVSNQERSEISLLLALDDLRKVRTPLCSLPGRANHIRDLLDCL